MSSPAVAEALNLMFERPDSEDALRWFSQALAFSPVLPTVLVQRKGGPCGVLAALEAHVVVYLTFMKVESPRLALLHSCYEILDRAYRAPSSEHREAKKPEDLTVYLVDREQSSKPESFNPKEKLIINAYHDVVTIKAKMDQLLSSSWSSDAGLMLFVLSLIFTRGPRVVKSDMDDPEARLTGQFGHCGQEMLNLIITGQASSQVHDGIVDLADTGLQLRGVSSRPRVGLLTRLEALRYCQVGSFLKNPEFPVWVIGSESHFTVLYSPDRTSDAKSVEQQLFELGKRVFTKKDTQENGFLKSQDVESVLQELGFVPQNEQQVDALKSLVKKCEMPGSEGIVLWTTFWPVIEPLLREKKTLDDFVDPTWSCLTCTFVNALKNNVCEMCTAARPPSVVVPIQAPSANAMGSQSREWACSVCTLSNGPNDSKCMVCGADRPLLSPQAMEATLMGPSQGGKRIELIHVDGLEKTIGGKVYPPKMTKLKLTTVESFLAGPGTSGFGSPFEEVLQTKWPGAIFEYESGESAPSIEG